MFGLFDSIRNHADDDDEDDECPSIKRLNCMIHFMIISHTSSQSQSGVNRPKAKQRAHLAS